MAPAPLLPAPWASPPPAPWLPLLAAAFAAQAWGREAHPVCPDDAPRQLSGNDSLMEHRTKLQLPAFAAPAQDLMLVQRYAGVLSQQPQQAWEPSLGALLGAQVRRRPLEIPELPPLPVLPAAEGTGSGAPPSWQDSWGRAWSPPVLTKASATAVQQPSQQLPPNRGWFEEDAAAVQGGGRQLPMPVGLNAGLQVTQEEEGREGQRAQLEASSQLGQAAGALQAAAAEISRMESRLAEEQAATLQAQTRAAEDELRLRASAQGLAEAEARAQALQKQVQLANQASTEATLARAELERRLARAEAAAREAERRLLAEEAEAQRLRRYAQRSDGQRMAAQQELARQVHEEQKLLSESQARDKKAIDALRYNAQELKADRRLLQRGADKLRQAAAQLQQANAEVAALKSKLEDQKRLAAQEAAQLIAREASVARPDVSRGHLDSYNTLSQLGPSERGVQLNQVDSGSASPWDAPVGANLNSMDWKSYQELMPPEYPQYPAASGDLYSYPGPLQSMSAQVPLASDTRSDFDLSSTQPQALNAPPQLLQINAQEQQKSSSFLDGVMALAKRLAGKAA